jgi:hypothetical protein
MVSFHRSIAVFCLTSIACAEAYPATTMYTTSASFLATVASGSYLETFTQPEVDTGLMFSYSTNGFAYSITANDGMSDVYRSGTFVGSSLPAESLTIAFTSGNVTAVGGNFFITDITDAFQASSVTLTLNDGTVLTHLPTDETGAFSGFTSDMPILSLTMSAPPSPLYNSLDNLVVGSMIPEPGTYGMMGLGWVCLLAMLRLRSRR